MLQQPVLSELYDISSLYKDFAQSLLALMGRKYRPKTITIAHIGKPAK